MGVVFGRKGVGHPKAPPPARDGMGREEMDAGTDAVIASLSQSLGIDLDFDIAYIFAPSLWFDPAVKRLIDLTGMQPESRGNKISLLRNPASVAHFAQLSPEEPLRQALINSGFGMVQYNPIAANGFNDQLTEMQRGQLSEWASRTDLSDEGRMYAVINLHRFSSEVLKGNVAL